MAGFMPGRTHQIIPNMVCALEKKINTQVLESNAVRFYEEFQIPAYSETGKRTTSPRAHSYRFSHRGDHGLLHRKWYQNPSYG